MADVVATVAVVFATCGMLYIMWQMLLPSLLADVIAIFVAVFVADVMATMADVIAINKTDVIGRCYLPGWQME